MKGAKSNVTLSAGQPCAQQEPAEQIGRLEGIDECIRFYPPNIEKIHDPEVIFRKNREISLYIHIPFCRISCGFCPFNQYAYQEHEVKRYLTALEKEIGIIRALVDFDRCRIRSLWIGGGTPSDLSEEFLTKLLEMVRGCFDLTRLEEFTIEAKPTPDSLTDEKMRILEKNEVRRVSLGVQSFNQKYLDILGRNYTVAEVSSKIREIQAHGFDMNLDMMYKLPGQSLDEVNRDIDGLSSFEAEHVTLSQYIPVAGSPFLHKIELGKLESIPGRVEYYEMFCSIVEKMKAQGYQQYTPYHFTKRKQSAYHVHRWKMPQLEKLALGAGGFSFFNGWIYANAHNIDPYVNMLSSDRPPIAMAKQINPIEETTRLAVLGIKFFTISKADFKRRTGVSIDDLYGPELERLQELGLVKSTADSIECTTLGKAFNNEVAYVLSVESAKGVFPRGIDLKKAGV